MVVLFSSLQQFRLMNVVMALLLSNIKIGSGCQNHAISETGLQPTSTSPSVSSGRLLLSHDYVLNN